MAARVLLLAVVLALTGLGAVASPATATCYLDPDDPVPGVTCGATTVRCVLATVKHQACPV